MYGRENLKVYSSCELYYKASDEFKVGEAYLKDEANKVMDAMEARIKELEERLEDVQNTMATENVDLGMENFKLQERIKELESQLPKWISTNDRLPDKSGEYQVVHKSIRGSSRFVTTDIFNARNSQWQRAILPKLHTHWAELLPPPPTEEK